MVTRSTKGDIGIQGLNLVPLCVLCVRPVPVCAFRLSMNPRLLLFFLGGIACLFFRRWDQADKTGPLFGR
jgi:hypothetical protein